MKDHEKNKFPNSPMEYIIWTSGLTAQPYIDRLTPQNYTIQIWTDSTVSNQIQNKYICYDEMKFVDLNNLANPFAILNYRV